LWKLVLIFASKAEKNATTVKLAEKIITVFPVDVSVISAVQKELSDILVITKPVLQNLVHKLSVSEKKDRVKEEMHQQDMQQETGKDLPELKKQKRISKKSKRSNKELNEEQLR